MDSKLAALLAALSVAMVAIAPTTSVSDFDNFKSTYGKKYGPQEEAIRFAVYQENLQKIADHNAKGASWTMAENQFADLTQEEFEAVILMNNLPAMPVADEIYEATEAPVGDVNWVT
jgi:hypothetical protein